MKIFSKQKNKDNQKGFTIIETLVAIFVLLITTTGPLAFTQRGLQQAFLARDQVTAFFLAQESIEIIKNIRDNNTLAARTSGSVNWLDGLGACDPNDGTALCNIGLSDLGNIRIVDCGPTGCTSPLGYDENTKNFYIQIGTGDPTPSKYTRTVYVSQVKLEEIQIIVEVSWESTFLTPKRIVVQENIFKKF